MSQKSLLDSLAHSEEFINRHIGPSKEQTQAMLDYLGVKSIEALIDKTVPNAIQENTTNVLNEAKTEHVALSELKALAKKNQIFKNYIGLGYHDTYVPPVIQRNVLENPGWYTAYTPYQPEIAQGRLEGLLNYQHMIAELTGMDMANASMLDEATAAAEAMAMAKRIVRKNKSNTFLSTRCVFRKL